MNSHKRTRKGQISDFGAALMLLVCFVLFPLMNLSFIPVRYMITQGAMSELVRRLAHSDKYSEAQAQMKRETWWKTFLGGCGVDISKERMFLLITTSDGAKSFSVSGDETNIPDQWLPGGENAPCIYTLSVAADCSIAPLYAGPFQPPTVSVAAHAEWENLSKDPQSLRYFINE